MTRSQLAGQPHGAGDVHPGRGADAQALRLDTSRATYTPLSELPTATDKARRDAPAIAVCDLTNPTL